MRRKKKKGVKFIWLILIILIIFTVYNNWPFIKEKEEIQDSEIEVVVPDRENIDEEVDLLEKKDNIEISYPETGNKIIDQEIRKNIEERVSDFRKTAEDDQSLKISYTMNRGNENIISIKYNYLYEGGARPIVEVDCFSYDIKTSRKILIRDVFNGDYEDELFSIVKSYLMRSSDTISINQDSKLFDNFLLYNDRIVFYFSPCLVDSCSAGVKQAIVYFSDIDSMINKGFTSKEVEEEGLVISNLNEGDIIDSPLTITGRVNGGGWICFEGEVGVAELFDNNGNKLGLGIMTAVDDCMQKKVEFTASIVFNKYGDSGFIIFYNENPSGLKENDKYEMIKVRFKQ